VGRGGGPEDIQHRGVFSRPSPILLHTRVPLPPSTDPTHTHTHASPSLSSPPPSLPFPPSISISPSSTLRHVKAMAWADFGIKPSRARRCTNNGSVSHKEERKKKRVWVPREFTAAADDPVVHVTDGVPAPLSFLHCVWLWSVVFMALQKQKEKMLSEHLHAPCSFNVPSNRLRDAICDTQNHRSG
jgi:hypothetical protein